MSRKLQAEIDRVLKKVSEGIDEFENFYEKVQTATTTSLKEKHEADLKKEIKKLQRLRDQIKVWIQSSEVKEKHDLIHHRKLIEKQMERFKAIEKEMKTKAYSKEGLSQSVKMDPREKQKQEVINWLTEMIDKLSTQIDVYEVESEQLSSSVSKKKKDAAKVERIKAIDSRVEHHKDHINCLERIQRLLENESLSVEQILNIQEDVNYYVDENDNDDFAEDESIYDDLDLDNEELFNIANDFDSSSDESDSTPVERTSTNNSVSNPPETELSASTIETRANVNLKMNISIPTAPLEQRNVWKGAKDSVINISKTKDTPMSSPIVSTPKISLGPNIISTPAKPQALAHPWAAIASQGKNVASGIIRTPSTASSIIAEKSSILKTEAAPKQIQKTATDKKLEELKSIPAANTKAAKNGVNSDVPAKPYTDDEQPQPVAPTLQKQAEAKKQSPLNATKETALASSKYLDEDLFDKSNLPASLSKLRTFYSRTKTNYIPLSKDSVYRKNMMDLSLHSIPTVMDQEKAKQYTPQQPVPTPSYYPQTSLPILSQPTTFANLGIETLFFIFYYQKNTYYQYLAVKELKKQSWRFHKRYLTWFQRYDEPSQITEEYEKGTYLYFDYEGSWTQKKKTDFVFEYQYLE